MRLIDADALIKAIHDEWDEVLVWDESGETTAYEFERLVDDAPTIEYKPKWIPCSERLPEAPFACLVTVMDIQPTTLEEFENLLPYFVGFDGGRWNDMDGEECPHEILAWMPLPEPYKEVE